MGKRRSNTQKKKQAKASNNKLVKAFAKKLGMGSAPSPDSMKIEITGSGKKNKPLWSSSKKLMAKISKEQQKKSKKDASVPVQDDFLHEQQSLRQRELQIEWKRNLTKTSRRNRSQQQQPPAFTPASFIVDDAQKSVDQLVVEAAAKVKNLGFHNTPSKQEQIQPTPFSTPKSMLSWTDEPGEEDAAAKRNPWAVLADDDDDEENNHQRQQHRPPQLSLRPVHAFNFAPPTFMAASGSNVASAEIDPDL